MILHCLYFTINISYYIIPGMYITTCFFCDLPTWKKLYTHSSVGMLPRLLATVYNWKQQCFLARTWYTLYAQQCWDVTPLILGDSVISKYCTWYISYQVYCCSVGILPRLWRHALLFWDRPLGDRVFSPLYYDTTMIWILHFNIHTVVPRSGFSRGTNY